MIQMLSGRFRRPIAAALYLTFYLQMLCSMAARGQGREMGPVERFHLYDPADGKARVGRFAAAGAGLAFGRPGGVRPAVHRIQPTVFGADQHIGGPATPEASSFKAVGQDNLVNLFTGDFSYSIPLLDVGGYPVNLFYNGGIGMEQEASWVGLGWNINPGSVSRNMRGVPDDFDGTDTLVQTQQVKPNKTYGGVVGVDGEVLGIKKPKVNLTLGVSYNNYLGPDLDLGSSVSLAIPIIQTVMSEKSAPDTVLGLHLGLDAHLSSRSGLTLSPSLNAGLALTQLSLNGGIGISTSYNSRTGIKDLNISSQASVYRTINRDAYGLPPLTLGIGDNNLGGTVISFARPSYVPTLRMPMQSSYSGAQLEFGTGMFGLRGAATAKGYYEESAVADGATTIYKPMVGYMYLQNARGRDNVVMDFNRLNDGPVTPNTPLISAPQYDYDIFSIQGEGTGGSIRAYRNDLGFMRDILTTSKDKNISLGADIAPLGHYGGNVNIVSTPTSSGNWDDANNTLNQTLQFSPASANSLSEHVYFRNPGETTVTNDTMISRIGRDNLVRYELDGSLGTPVLATKLEQFTKKTCASIESMSLHNTDFSRDKRTQVITMLNASDASIVGQETSIRSYLPTLDSSNNLRYSSMPRVSDYRKGHHISEVTVLESNGMRYVYGLPVYNTVQKDFTFSVRNIGNSITNLVNYNYSDTSIVNQNITGNTGIDGYVSTQQTPAYASSFLLTGLMSPDYVDVTGDGITEDDLGTAVKFDYTLSTWIHKWRTPRPTGSGSGQVAHFNVGLKTEIRDNKATISYGERESWYLYAIESKSMIAIFSKSSRNDAKGVSSAGNGVVIGAENANLKLDSIRLFTKADLKAHGLAGAVPVKTVHFEYNYSLCPGTPDNDSAGGKLTLNDIYFTFNGQSRVSKDMYLFNYGNIARHCDNAGYAPNASDRWGTYKPALDSAGVALNPAGMSNVDYPYTLTSKTLDDQFAGEWALKKILLPSGGQMEISYEADDYAYVQDKRACNLYPIYGFGTTSSFTTSPFLYLPGGGDQNYVYVHLPSSLHSSDPVKAKQEILAKYLDGMTQLAFKLNVNMPKGVETINAYALLDAANYGLCPNSTDSSIIYLKVNPQVAGGPGPLANASIQFLIYNLPGQAFPGYDMSGVSGIQAFLKLVVDALSNLYHSFTNSVSLMRDGGKGSSVSLASSFIRLASPTFFKYGGGHRVKRVVLKDNWDAMHGNYKSTYGQDYDYTTTQMVNGISTTISSGVASYEPGIGSEENPFRTILQYKDQLPLASAQYGAIEMPVLEAFYPSPVVGYSKVTVRSIHRNGTHGDSVVRSAIGKQVTEFYTARDFPAFSTYTPMNSLVYHHSPAFTFFSQEIVDRRTISQGFLVETNDMHGKLKKQSVYSESDENTPLSYTIHTYRNTGANGLNDLVDFVHNDQSGAVTSGNMGVDMELMTDVRQFKVMSDGTNTQANVDFFTFAPFPISGIFIYPLGTHIENTYKAVTTTKLINYHAIEDTVIVNDKGSTIASKAILYDAETGMPVVTKTANEYNDPVYNVTYPAYWAYSGMAPAYKNIGMSFAGINIGNGLITNSPFDQSVFESGDEVYVNSMGSGGPGCSPSPYTRKLWVYDTSKNTTALTVPSANRQLLFIDSAGAPYSIGNLGFVIVRSGNRNRLDQKAETVTCMANPIQIKSGVRKLWVDSTVETVAAAATAFKEKWQTDWDVIPTTSYKIVGCDKVEYPDCGGTLPNHVNPYLRGLIGNYKPYRSYTYYGSRVDSNPSVNTLIRKNGYIQSFGGYWNFDTHSNLVPDNTNTKWLWNTELTKVNSKGQELETRDALLRYTSAEYGYAKDFAIALTQNAQYGQSFYEGFEDKNYNEDINVTAPDTCDNTQYINFKRLANTSIINTDTSAIKAHTGKYMIAVNAHDSGVLAIPVQAAKGMDYTLAFGHARALSLNDTGVNTQYSPATSNAVYQRAPSVNAGTTNVFINDPLFGNAATRGTMATVGITWQGFIKITAFKMYHFTLAVSVNYGTLGRYSASHSIVILDSSGVSKYTSGVSADGLATGDDMASISDSVMLCPGIYQIQGSFFDNVTIPEPGYTSGDQASWICTDCGFPLYKDTTTTVGCLSTTAIPSDTAQLNSLFTLQPGQKMQLSAWVRQDCGNGSGKPCFVTNYTNDHLGIKFPHSTQTRYVSFHPSGIIIEGWQKVEGVFTVPTDETTAQLILGSDSAEKVYFDDIRLHPFNADMKTYVYDPRTLRLTAEMDENNYATLYDYDEDGQLVRVRRETIEGIKPVKETRAAKQKLIKAIQN